MLQELTIRNFALLEGVQIPFGEGLNVLTGETGAGKSIIIDALGAVLGGRVTTEAIRTGTDRALVEAVFLLPARGPARGRGRCSRRSASTARSRTAPAGARRRSARGAAAASDPGPGAEPQRAQRRPGQRAGGARLHPRPGRRPAGGHPRPARAPLLAAPRGAARPARPLRGADGRAPGGGDPGSRVACGARRVALVAAGRARGGAAHRPALVPDRGDRRRQTAARRGGAARPGADAAGQRRAAGGAGHGGARHAQRRRPAAATRLRWSTSSAGPAATWPS